MRIRRSPLAWLIVSVALLTTVLADDDVSALLVPPVLDLQTAQRIALRKNPSLQAADARVREARARVRNATAQFFPTLGISGSGTRTRTSENTAREIETTASPFDQAAIDELGAIVRNAAQELELVDRRARRDADMKRRNALRDRPLLLEAEVRRQAANERERQAYRDALERELSDLSVSQNVLDVLQRQTAVDVDETRTSYGTGLYATWQIFDGFSRKFNRVAARHGETESRFSRRDAQRLLLGAVALAYYEVHLASERIAIAKADLDFNTRLLGDARARHKAGRASLSIVLNFEVRQNAALSAMFEARRRLRSGWIGLAALMGVSVAELPGDIQLAAVHGKGGDDVTLPDEDAAIRYGMEHRPDLAATRATLDRAQAAVGIVRSTFYPSVELAGSYGVSRPDNVDFEEDDLAGAIALVVRYDLFRGGERLAQISEANALRDKAAALLAQAQIEIVSEIRDAVSRLDATGEIFELQSRNVDLVERTRDLVELEYNAGGASLVRLNEAQRDLVEVRSRHATALASLRVAWHQLLQATAQPLEAVPDP